MSTFLQRARALTIATLIAFAPLGSVLAQGTVTLPAKTPAPAVTLAPPGYDAAPGTPLIGVSTSGGGGIINIGGVFGPILEPYVNSLVAAILSLLAGWVLWVVRTKFKINIDQAQADTILRAAKNQASGLVAAGFVKFEQNGKIKVDNAALAAAANDMLKSVPDAASHFTLTNKPDVMADKIVAQIPQVPAAAAISASAHTDANQHTAMTQ